VTVLQIMASRSLRSRSQSVESRATSVWGNGEENTDTQFSPEDRGLSEATPNHESLTSHLEFEDTGNEPAIGSATPNELPNSIPDTQLRDVLTTLQQAIKSELTSAMQNLRAEIKNDREELIRSLTSKCEVAQNKMKESFEVKINSEILIVSEEIYGVRRNQEVEVNKLYSAIEEVNAKVNEKINTDINRVKEYVGDKCRSVSGAIQLAKENAEEISKVNNKLGE